jgi:hypothetical protein
MLIEQRIAERRERAAASIAEIHADPRMTAGAGAAIIGKSFLFGRS